MITEPPSVSTSSPFPPVVRDRLRTIQAKVQKMMRERPTVLGMETTPSEYWKHYIRQFEHLIFDQDLTPFLDIRRRTQPITGAGPADHPAIDHKVRSAFERLRLPPWVFDTVQEPRAYGGFGLDIGGRLVNRDIVRYLAAFSVFDQAGLLTPATPYRTLEIGGGWGGLAHHMHRVFPRSTHVIVDLPETLIYSAAYLTLQNPDQSLYIYDSADDPECLMPSFLLRHSWVLLPHWKIKDLPAQFFDLAINIASLQEMTVAQVEEYLREIRRTTSGFFYSQNKKNKANHELENVHALIEKQFYMTFYETNHSPRLLGRLRAFLRTLRRGDPIHAPTDNAHPQWRREAGYVHYLCRARPHTISAA